MRTRGVPAPPPPTDGGDHLLVSVDGGPWQAATSADPATLALPGALRPDQLQRIDFAVWNPTDVPVELEVVAPPPLGLAVTPPAVRVEAPRTIAPHASASGTVTVVTPSWEGEEWMGARIEMPITIRAAGEGAPGPGLAATGADPGGATGLGIALLALGAIAALVIRRNGPRRLARRCGGRR